MFVATTRVQREISAIAADLGEKAAKDSASGLRRLELPEGPANSLLGSIKWVKEAIDKILPAQQGEEKIDLTPAAAKAWRICLATWIRVVTKRAEADKAKGLDTNVHTLKKAAQGVLDQLHDQLSLPVVDIASFVEAEKDDEEEEGEDDGQLDIEKDPAVQPAPHRGRSTKPPRTAGAKTRNWTKGR